MFNGGKNGKYGSPLEQDKRIGTSYIAYDCNFNIVCAAAFLDESFLTSNPNIQVEQNDGESWIRFGPNDGETKLKESNADMFKYVSKLGDDDFIIGYEGCWNIDLDDPKMQSITNNFVEVHFTRGGGETTSTGKPASNGKYICLNPECNHSSSYPTLKPTANPTVQPSYAPSESQTSIPSSYRTDVPSVEPTKQQTDSPSSSPISSLTKIPTSHPSSSPSISPTSKPKAVRYDENDTK